MEKLYIKFIEWDKNSLNEACNEAERLWYKKADTDIALRSTWLWLLRLEGALYISTHFNENELLLLWFKEHIIKKQYFKPSISEIKYRDNIFTFVFDKDFILATIFLNWETIANDFLPDIDNLWLLTNNSEANEIFETNYNVDILNRWMDYVLDYKLKNNGME